MKAARNTSGITTWKSEPPRVDMNWPSGIRMMWPASWKTRFAMLRM
jgi:hypothetical protein